jgi:hypothetical protein
MVAGKKISGRVLREMEPDSVAVGGLQKIEIATGVRVILMENFEDTIGVNRGGGVRIGRWILRRGRLSRDRI